MSKESARGRSRRERYNRINEAFLYDKRGTECPVIREIFGEFAPINQIHHVAGRAGERLFKTEFFLAVSQRAHDWIHAHPREARKHGWLVVNEAIIDAMECALAAK